MDFPIGTSNTPGVDPDFTLPLRKGFGGSFDGAYFFTKNYGVGLKYHLFSSKAKDVWMWLIPDDKYIEYTFNETIHFVGPAFYGRWAPGDGKLEFPASISISYVRNKISDYCEKIRYWQIYDPDHSYTPDPDRYGKDYGRSDTKSHSIGFVLSAGVSYQILPAISVGVYVDGMLSSAKKESPATNLLTGESFTFVFSRKMNRIGISAGINYCF
jgi:long-subunit fatty acid transport protein